MSRSKLLKVQSWESQCTKLVYRSEASSHCFAELCWSLSGFNGYSLYVQNMTNHEWQPLNWKKETEYFVIWTMIQMYYNDSPQLKMQWQKESSLPWTKNVWKAFNILWSWPCSKRLCDLCLNLRSNLPYKISRKNCSSMIYLTSLKKKILKEEEERKKKEKSSFRNYWGYLHMFIDLVSLQMLVLVTTSLMATIGT